EPAGAHPLHHVEEVDGADPLEHQELPGEVDQHERAGEHHAALEPAGGIGLRVRRQPPAHHDARSGEHQRHHAHRGAGPRDVAIGGLVDRGAIPLPAQVPQHDRDTRRGGEQDELLAYRVEAAVQEVHRGDHPGRVCLRDRDLEDGGPVRAGIVPEPRQPGQSPQVKGRQAGPGEQEDPAALGLGHSSGFRTLARVSSSTTGSATAPIVSADSVTSGAWNERKSTASSTPYTLSATTWRTGCRISTTAAAPAAISTSTVTWSTSIMTSGTV